MRTPVCQSSALVDGTYSVRLDGGGTVGGGSQEGEKAATQAQAGAVVDDTPIYV